MTPAPAAPARVLHLLPHARTLAGTERTVLALMRAPELAHLEQRVAFVQPGRVEGFERSTVLGGAVARMLPGAALGPILRWRPDILHGWLLQGNALAAVVQRLCPRAVVITSQRDSTERLTGLRPLLERLVAGAEDVATANSPAVRDVAVARLPQRAARFVVISPGVVAPAPAAHPRAATAVMVGRLHPVKDHATALRAWRLVVDACPAATLAIVGDGGERDALIRLAAELELGAAVRFRGYADPAPDLYGARLFLASSRVEGFSRALLEALAVGLPVVTTAVAGTEDLDPDAVRRAPVGDAAALAAHVLDLLADEERLGLATAAARAEAQRFTPARCHAAYARLYEESLSRGHHAR